ncbi:hypothetical protein ACQY0O_003793 [Thecaphora frezii]
MDREFQEPRRNPLPFHTTTTSASPAGGSSSSTSAGISNHSSTGGGSNSRSRYSPLLGSHSSAAASPALTYASRISSPPIMSPKSGDGHPMISSYTRYEAPATSSYSMLRPHDSTAANSQPRVADVGASPWGEGMRSLMSSIIGAPAPIKGKATSSPSFGKGAGGERSASDPYAPLPLQAHEVEAATSNWSVPRETITMTMGFQGGYEDQSLVQPLWQSQVAPSYPNDHSTANPSGFAAPYPQQPTPSGLPGAGADAPRSRPNAEFPALSESRDYARRPLAPHSRGLNSTEFPSLAHSRPVGGSDATANNWWPQEHGAQVAADAASAVPSQDPRGQHWSAAAVTNGRRVNAPPLPETRSTGRTGWSGMSTSSSSSVGFEGGQYEFSQTSLGKRPHEEDPNVASGVGDYSDPAYRRYSLAPNMVFSRSPVSGQSNATMTTYRPPVAGSDPRRPLASGAPGTEHAYPASGMLPPQSSRPYPTGSGAWSGNWGSAPHPTGLSAGIAATPSPHSSPAANGWKEGMPRHPQDATIASPSLQANGVAINSAKRHRRQNSATGGGNSLQSNLLATTPFHITTDIVLRAPPGSKMEDVYYDQHCEIQTGMPDPPASDFDVENEEDRPRLQTDKLRFPGDLYTPRWVRGTGNAREAWCDRCEHGNWLQLKNSQYWYDQVHKHGISSVSGLRFTAPTHLRVYADAAGTVEGKCHQCKEWVLICTAKRRRNFAAFFKHAHACHSYRKASAVGNGPIVEHNPGHKKKQMMA